MGSIVSSLLGGSRDNTSATDDESSVVKQFHSSESWKLHLDSVKDSSQLIVVDFSASWCGPCRMMEPVINSLAKTFSDVMFVKIDVDELKEVAQEFSVEAMPTFVLLKKGKEVDRIVGAHKDELKKKIKTHRPTS